MYIKSLALENIRSYKSQTINFLEGINFLSGDIGSGKSSILQAIEFALFGFKRGDLEGYHLLRKGKTKASVKLLISDNKKEIEILRNIKKSKSTDNITQENGYLKIDKNLIELSPTELNAHIFDLLNFPKEFLSKDKNLIYRFTTYTPQEQLKEILFAETDKRLEIIRKLFNIDKYKTLQNAILIYSQKIREDKKILQSKLEPKDNLSEETKQIEIQLKEINSKLKEKQEIESQLKEKLLKHKTAIEKREMIIEQINQNKTKLETSLAKLAQIEETNRKYLSDKQEKKKELETIQKQDINTLTKQHKNKIKEFEKEIKETKFKKEKLLKNLEEFSQLQKEKEKLQKYISDLENKKSIIKSKSDTFDYMLTKCQVKDLENAIKKLNTKITKTSKKKAEFDKLKENITKLELQLTSDKQQIESNNKKLKDFSKIKHCPTCYQDISCEHKGNIETQLKKELETFQIQITKNTSQLTKLKLEKNSLEEELKSIDKQEKQLIEKEQKLLMLREKEIKEKKLYDELKELKKEILQNNNSSEQDKLTSLNNKLKEETQIRKQIEELNSKEIEVANQSSNEKIQVERLLSTSNKINTLKEDMNKLEETIKKQEEILRKRPVFETKLKELNEKVLTLKQDKQKLSSNYEILQTKEKELINLLSTFKTQITEKQSHLKEKQKQLENISKVEIQFDKLLKDEDLLLNKTTDITSKIERTLLTKFYVEFTENFESLFKDLIEDNEIEVRLDENFSPVVEQNGYDIDIKNLSGGEKSSLAVAYRLGLKRIIENNLEKSQKLSLLILDEPTDGFSNEQIDRLGNILKQTNLKQIILVSHDEKIESIADDILHVEKTNHISSVS